MDKLQVDCAKLHSTTAGWNLREFPISEPSGFIFTTGLKPVLDRNRPVLTLTQGGVVPVAV